MKLNVYKSQTEIEKTFEADAYDLMYGTVEDILGILDVLDETKDTGEAQRPDPRRLPRHDAGGPARNQGKGVDSVLHRPLLVRKGFLRHLKKLAQGGGGKTASLYEMFFDLTESLCKRYTSLTPFAVRREKVGEVLLLVRRINEMNDREHGIGKRDTITRDSKGNVHIRREAINDNWY